ncbi:MAG: cytochrome ubiquinol oxidase subunit I [Cobetia sp.]|jgi:cytochrome d ubiquinol oxidase subunit I|uniref:cytochrome ubiquinol oxidase subunit I n=1 Tax=Cobetia sp. TaxID=1873876 RepID=UPI000C4937FF|nr:cytochrome ubiquinol oxidase subunit I [Cobetia sp.]MBF10423.1 cytochrome ubiquinol oxidase subunit I [Cobetia sp.]MBK10821.1 cytochrome ubiquinol oxidase subunit I [Cobetia sp.]HBJ27221.1 cytochrome ubiquinol oxidase subunit I [Cobetia sp.]|tara:strand:+ start:2084 stop:3499 length:1416 start_codon:yes stop_codon:yes gene_type:complete
MFGTEAIDLARIQFAFTISFHIIFPAITIGLASYLAVLEGMWLKTGTQVYRNLYHFWSKIFAVNFAMGVVSGLVMAYQFGTHWSGFSAFAGSVTGPLLTYEVLTAFFLEAGFLGVMLFGWNRVGRGLHFFSTCMVALGTLVSMFWILSSNSWMQTPQGHEVIDGIVVPVDWLAIVFNPSFPYRLAHMALASFLSTSLFVAASAAWLLLKKRDTPEVRKMLVMAVLMLMVTAPLQAFVGDMHGLNTLKHQPAKIAAIEGHWDNSHGEPTPLILFGVPDMQREETRFALEIPALGSLLLMHDIDKQVPALKDFPAADRPNSTVVFWSFRLMVGLGLAMILLGLSGVYLARKGRLFTSRRWLRLAVAMGPAGLIAILAGWFTTEVGRQPWVIYGLMRTEDAVSAHSAVHLSISLTAFVTVYFIVFGTGINYICKLIKKGPEGDDSHAPSGGPGKPRTPSRPLSAIEESLDGTTH